MNQQRLDDLTRAFVSDEVSRARMLKVLGKALLASTLGGFGLMSVNDGAEAKPKTCVNREIFCPLWAKEVLILVR